MTPEQARKPRAQGGIEAMGKAWWATGDTQYAKAYEQFYLTTNTGDLFNWGPFAGGQAAVEFPAHLFMLDCPAYSSQGKIAVLDHLLTLNQNAWEKHTARWSTLMLGPEGHNWYMHGIDSIPYLATLFPELTQADFLLKTSWSIVEEHLRGNYHRDGGSRECTPSYHGGSIRILWSMYAMLKHNNHASVIKPSPAFESNLLRATHFLIRAMTPLGGVPAFGDSGATHGALASILSLAAVLSGDGLCKWAAEQSHKHLKNTIKPQPGTLPYAAFWVLGIDGAKAYEAVKATPPSFKSTCLPDSGFALMRHHWQGDSTGMAINAATRGTIVTSHEHNDIFSFDLYAKGTCFMGQAGIAAYGKSPGRSYDVSTRAHNCLTIKDQEQLPIATEWRWSTTVIPRIRRWDVTDTLEIFHGVHEGFCRFTTQGTAENPDQMMIHERKILFLKSEADGRSPYWVILDRVTANKSLPYEIWFHSCVPSTSTGNNLLLKAADDNALYLCPPVSDELALRQDTSDDRTAYAAEAKFDLSQHQAWCYQKQAESHVFAWVLSPANSDKVQPVVERIAGMLHDKPADEYELTALRITHGQGSDSVVDELCVSHLLHDAQIGMEGQASVWGQTMWRRTTGGATHETVRSTLDGDQSVLV